MMARLAERMPDADIVQLADVGHWPQLEDPETVRAHLERILSS
jgi:pimeloyl-ACP methyl ester carboxylesterase